MTNEFVLEAITREFPDSVISSSQPYGMLTVEIKKDDIKKVIHYLKDSSLEINSPSIKYNVLFLGLNSTFTAFSMTIAAFSLV